MTTGNIWPNDLAAVLDYLGVRLGEGVGHSVILRAAHAHAFMDSVGGVPLPAQFTIVPLIPSVVEEHATLATADWISFMRYMKVRTYHA